MVEGAGLTDKNNINKLRKFFPIKRVAAVFGLLFLLFVVSVFLFFRHKIHAPAMAAGKVQYNVVYGHAGGEDLTMNLYFPKKPGSGPLPIVMYIHGGGWRMGGKFMVSFAQGPVELLRRGYVVASIDYRLAPQYKFPAMIEDAKCAVRFLRAQAKVLNLDPGRIGVMGDSAGGQLVTLLGLTDGSAGFDGEGGWSEQSSSVAAVVDLYGPSDFTVGAGSFEDEKLLVEVFGVTNADAPILKRASPVTYISTNAPPFLILHGDRDALVNVEESQELDARLKAAGDSSRLVIITNYAHGYTPIGLRPSLDNAGMSRLIADFFDQHLR